jgi:hemin uptake protein HemP
LASLAGVRSHRERLAGFFQTAETSPRCHNWLRGNTLTVNNIALQFISIVNCCRWNAPRAAYTRQDASEISKAHYGTMSATSGDSGSVAAGPTGSPSATTRTLTMRGSRIDSRELFAAEREIIIAHGDDSYRLRLTSQNKLILTK